jgi:hypothetical protein
VIAAVSNPRRRTVRRRVVGRCRRCVGFGVMGVMRLTRVTRVIHLRRVILRDPRCSATGDRHERPRPSIDVSTP